MRHKVKGTQVRRKRKKYIENLSCHSILVVGLCNFHHGPLSDMGSHDI